MGMDNRRIVLILPGKKRNFLHSFVVGSGASSVMSKGYGYRAHNLPPCSANAWSYTSAL